jgi:hypothetical protein
MSLQQCGAAFMMRCSLLPDLKASGSLDVTMEGEPSDSELGRCIGQIQDMALRTVMVRLRNVLNMEHLVKRWGQGTPEGTDDLTELQVQVGCMVRGIKCTRCKVHTSQCCELRP